MTRAYRYTTYSSDDSPAGIKCNREAYSQGCDALHDAMWSLAERIGGDYQLPPHLAMRLLQDRPTPDEVRG